MRSIANGMHTDAKLWDWPAIGLSLILVSVLGSERLQADDGLPPDFAPVLTRFKPVSGYPGDTIVLFGTNLVFVKVVRFNGVDAVFLPKDPLFNPELRAVVPKTASSGPITVITDDGETTSEEAFTVIPRPAPVVVDFSPKSGAENSSVNITGEHLLDIVSIQFNGVPATQFGDPSMSGGRGFPVRVPKGATTGPIIIVTEHGRVETAPFVVIPTQTILKVEGVSPMSGPPGTIVRIWGTGLDRNSRITINGLVLTFLGGDVVHLNGIMLRVPPEATTGALEVETAYGNWTSNTPFVVTAVPKPTILSMNPTEGIPGTAVMIRGQNLTRVKSVSFNGASATFSEVGDLYVYVPEGATTGPITVETEGGVAVSAQSFTVKHSGDIGVLLSALSEPVVVGRPMRYSVIVTNQGSTALRDVLVTNTLACGESLVVEPCVFQQGTGSAIDHFALVLKAHLTNAVPVETAATGCHFLTINNPSVVLIPQLDSGTSVRYHVSFVADTPGLYHLLASAGDFTQEIRVLDNRAVISVLGVSYNHLMIRRLDSAHVEISWPQEAEGYVLQEKSLGEDGSAWHDSENVPLLQGTRYSIVGDCQSISRSYRLTRP